MIKEKRVRARVMVRLRTSYTSAKVNGALSWYKDKMKKGDVQEWADLLGSFWEVGGMCNRLLL